MDPRLRGDDEVFRGMTRQCRPREGGGPVSLSRGIISTVSKVEKIEQEIKGLSAKELAEFRAWFAEFDWAIWDRQLEQDAAAGKLDALAEKALRDYAAGKTKPL